MAYTKTNWQNLPNQNTPINATNLNHIEQGIYDATYENGLNVSNEVDEDYRVNFVVQENLFIGTIEQGTINSEGELGGATTRIRTKEFINVQSNTTYQIKTTQTNPTLQLYVFEYTNNNVFVQRQPSDWIDAGDYIFKTSSTTGKIKIVFKYADNSDLLPSAITSLEVKENIPPSIYVDNEMLVSKNVYSTDEVVIGEWLGKPLYRKVIDCGNLPNATTKSIKHNISNLDKVINMYGSCSNGGNIFPLPYVSTGLISQIGIYCNNTIFVISTGGDRTDYTGYAILEYTKTTD